MKSVLKPTIIIINILMILILSGCKNNNENEEKLLIEKINTEISYLDSELISIINSLNNIHYIGYQVVTQEVENSSETDKQKDLNSLEKSSGEERSSQESGSNMKESGGQEESEKTETESKGSDVENQIFSMESNNLLDDTQEINWTNLKSKVEVLYTTVITINLDLKQMGFSDEELNEFSKKLDLLAQSIKNENREETLKNVIELYSYLPKFTDSYSENKNEVNVLNSKYKLLLCYQFADLEDWVKYEQAVSDLKITFSNVINKKDEYEGKSINISSAYVIINEMDNVASVKEKDIFFIKYKNLIQELNIILSI